MPRHANAEEKIPAITQLQQPIQQYALLVHKIDTLRKEMKELSKQKEMLGKIVCPLLRERPFTRQSFFVPEEHNKHFGSTYIGFRIYNRQRYEVFNGRTFPEAVALHCPSILQRHLPKMSEEDITALCEELATEVWSNRRMQVTEDIIAIPTPKPKPLSASTSTKNKRKPNHQTLLVNSYLSSSSSSSSSSQPLLQQHAFQTFRNPKPDLFDSHMNQNEEEQDDSESESEID